MHRRNFVQTALVSAAVSPALASSADTLPTIATNAYPWGTFYRRDGRGWNAELDAGLAEVASTGITGYEPIAGSPKQLASLAPLLEKHQLSLPSIYVNSTLHDPQRAPASIDAVLAIAAEAKKLGATIIVTNPSPIRWGGAEDKSDSQLREQAKSLGALGRQLRKTGLTLAYHNHDAELRQCAREFHHMLTATEPAEVKLCLDAHWIFRGCGDSQVAVFDALEHYYERVVELHLRQSTGGVWDEVFTMKSDLDYVRLFKFLKAKNIAPHLVLEQAVEARTPKKLSARQAHTQSSGNLESGLS